MSVCLRSYAIYMFLTGFLLSPHNRVGGDIVTRPFVGGWVSEWVRACMSGSVRLYLVDTTATTVFAQSLSNFTFTVMRGGTLLILGHGVKGQCQLRHSVYKTMWTRYRLQFLPNHFQTSHISCGWWEEEPYWFWVKGQGQLWQSVYKVLWAQYRLQFLSNHFQTSHVGYGWWGEKPYWFWVTG